MCFSSTLLPEPLGPMSTKISPGSTAKRDVLQHLEAAEFLRQILDRDADGGRFGVGERIAGGVGGGHGMVT